MKEFKNMKYMFLFVTLWAVLIGCSAENSKPKNGYIFTCPRTLILGSNNELNLKRYGDNLEGGNLIVQVFYKKDYSSKNETLAVRKQFKVPDGNSDLILNLPVDKVDEFPYGGRIQIRGSFSGQRINGSDSVNFSTRKNSIVIIQTDKPMYQPGQTVKFRVVKVNKKLKPCKKNSIVDIFVLDAQETRLFQFSNVDLSKGITQKEFPLSDEPVQGKWLISVEGKDISQVAYFDVKEYVLPKFDVSVTFPSYVLAKAKFVPVTICANYTYGEPVIGTLNLNASIETYYYDFYSSEGGEKYPTIEKSVKIDGCYKFKINISEIEIKGYSYRRITVVANVIEKGTGVQRNKTEFLQRQTSPLNLEFLDSLSYFKPGLPYNGKLKVSNPDNTPALGQPIEICATINKKRILAEWWATKTLQVCQNYTSNKKGIIKFILMPQNTDAISVELNAKSLKYKGDSGDSNNRNNVLSQPQTNKYLHAYYSPSGSFIQIQPVHEPVTCKSTPTLKLLYTAKKDSDYKFYYQVSRQSLLVLDESVDTSFSADDDVSGRYKNNDNVISGKLTQLDPPIVSYDVNQIDEDCPEAADSQYTPPIGEVNLDIDVNPSLSPDIHVLVYYVQDENEVVADSIKIKIENCLPNKVKFSFGDEIQQPGLETAVKINAAPNSLCGIRVVDKSVLLLDDSDNLTKEKVYQMLANLDTNNYYTSNPCYGNKIQPGLENVAFKSIIRPFPPISTSSYEDSLTAFQTSGYLVISNLFIVTRPCNSNNNIGRSFNEGSIRRVSKTASRKSVSFDSAAGSATQSVSAVRDNFPETWLFEMEIVGEDGMFATNKKLPDTITEWIGNAVCIGAEAGLGISNSSSITAFQAFFLDYTLPLSVIRGEEFVVVVSVFNYVDDALPVTISLDCSGGVEVTGNSIEGDICIQPKTSENLRLTLKATQIGKVNITVQAETSQSSSVCGDYPVSDSYAKDAIRKPIEVQPEGFPTDYVINSLFCPSDEENNVFETKVTLFLPDDVVSDSERAYVDISGNVLGPAIRNLDSLVSLPTGCGEQNMVKFTPNYLILDYLKDIGMLKEDIKSRALRNLNTGYQRELTYRHSDGSFSAFGQTDKDGSMFLTAFVLRSFHEAQRYIYIDETVLKQMQEFIVSKQQEDGCFPDVGRIIDLGLQGGVDTKSPGDITAYVLASLSISKLDNDTVIDDAFKCLKNNKPSTPYSQVLYSYAEALAGKKREAQNLIDEARQRLNKTDGMESFIIVNGTESIKNEAVGYAVLTTLAIGGSTQDVQPSVRYLTTHLNSNGGFKSTQDTCVGLQALSQFAAIVYKDPLSLEITITGGLEKKVEINDDDKLLVQRSKVSDVPCEIDVTATGTGCALIQTSVRYNTLNPPETKKFSLEVNGKCSNSKCNEAVLTVQVSYLPERLKSGMSVIQIKMITGFVPDRDSINGLQRDKSTNILRVDVEDNTVILYFSEISNRVQDFSFKVIQVVECLRPQPGTAKVFDYYANEFTTSTSYTIKEVSESGSDENKT